LFPLDLQAGLRGIDSRQGQVFFFFFTQPASIQWILGVLSPDVKRPERETDHSASSSAEVKNAWSYVSTPPRLHGNVSSLAQDTCSLHCAYVYLAHRREQKRDSSSDHATLRQPKYDLLNTGQQKETEPKITFLRHTDTTRIKQP